MNGYSVLIYKNRFIYVFVLLICFFILIEPSVFVFTDFHDFFRIGQVFILLTAIFVCYVKRCNVKLSLITILFFLYLLMVTYVNKGATVKVIATSLPVIGLVLVLQYSLEKNTYLTIKSLYIYFSIVVYINFIFLIINPEGILQIHTFGPYYTGYHFLGVSNQLGPYMLTAATISLIYINMNGKFTLNILLLNICIYMTIISVSSATSLIWITLFYILIFIAIRKLQISKLFTWGKVTITIFLIHLLIVFFKVQKWFSYFILEILEKDLTLSGRTAIWDEALQLISKSYVFGYGEIQSARYITVGTAQFNAHNIFLQILLQGGIIFLFLFIVIFIISLRNSRYCRVDSIRYYLLLAAFILFNMMVSEVYSFVIIFLLFTLINNGDLYKLSSKKDGQLIAVHR